MDQIYEETKLVLKEHEEKLMVLAEALLEHETLNEDKIIELIA